MVAGPRCEIAIANWKMFKASTATVNLTPDDPLWLAGYAARTAPAKGKISDLCATVLALEDSNGQRFVILSADLIALPRQITEPIVEAVRARTGLPRDRMLFA